MSTRSFGGGRRRRLCAAMVAALLVATASLVMAGPADAASTLPPIKQKGSKNVTADALPAPQIDGVVLTQVVVGNTVFAGGEFTNVRPAAAPAGTQLSPRSNLLSYDIATGELRTFAPALNGRVKALALSADKTTLFVGGTFTLVGTDVRSRFAAFDVKTGALKATIKPSVNNSVNALAVTKTAVYLGGNFTKVNGVTRSRLAAVSATSGKLLGWAPVADDTVQALTATPDQTKIIAGGHFHVISAINAYGLAAMDATTGKRKTWKVNRVVRDWGDKSAILSLTADNDTVYGSGYAYHGGNFEGVFAASPTDGAIRWLQDCHGDTYSVAPIGNVIYSVGHAHFCSNIGGFPDTKPRTAFYRSLAMTKAATGTVGTNTQKGDSYGNFAGQPAPSLYNWFPDLNDGTYTGLAQGAWSVAGNASYITLGGEFTEVNGVPQQGLVRFAIHAYAPRKEGPMDKRPTSAPWVEAAGTTGAKVSWVANWNRDDITSTYEVLRLLDGEENPTVVYTAKVKSVFWDRPITTWTDSGLTPGTRYRYQIQVTDPDQNSWTSAVTVFRTTPYAATVRSDGASHQWRLGARPGSTTEPDQVGTLPLALGSQVTLGTTGALRSDTDTAAALSGNAAALAASTAEKEPASQQASIELWFKTSTAGGTLAAFAPFDSATPTSRYRELYLTPTGRVAYAVRADGAAGTDAVFAASAGSVVDGAWHHVVAVQTATAVQLYVDGSLAAATTAAVTVASPGRWWLGGATPPDLANAGPGNFAGTLDEAAVYRTALGSATVAAHYAAAMP